jgi:hypothetical protein
MAHLFVDRFHLLDHRIHVKFGLKVDLIIAHQFCKGLGHRNILSLKAADPALCHPK